MALARIQLPELARRGELVEVRIIIQHAMETGFRKDVSGRSVRRNAVHSLTCRYAGAEVFRATLSTGISANPYLRFYTRAVATGDLEFWWLDDDDVEARASARLVVV
jgi:sulfur-oxidizing protein SoxZ